MPDPQGCVFADDFSSGDLTQWIMRFGHVGVVSKEDKPDDQVLMFHRKDYDDVYEINFNQEVWLHDFPRLNEVWIKWDIKLHDVETRVKDNRSSAFAIFRPFHYNHSEVFAVLLHEQKDRSFRLGVQWGKRPQGILSVDQDRWYSMKFHWKRPDAGGQNGIIETWIDGVADIQSYDENETTADHYFDRFAMGFMHCGYGRS
jgi:hypothetical protein